MFYEGNLRSYGGGVSNRLYFTFDRDGAKCTKPATIEAVFVLHQPQSIPVVTVLLKATMTRFLKFTHVWTSGQESVKVIIQLEMVLLVSSQYSGFD